MGELKCRRLPWCVLDSGHRGRCCATLFEAQRAAEADLSLAIEQASQCHFCGEYAGEHLPICPIWRSTVNRYRVIVKLPSEHSREVRGVYFIDAQTPESAGEICLSIAGAGSVLVSSVIEKELTKPAPISLEEQRDGLICAMRPIYSVCRALLDNPSTAPLFTEQMRKGLEGMCTDAVKALRDAGAMQ